MKLRRPVLLAVPTTRSSWAAIWSLLVGLGACDEPFPCEDSSLLHSTLDSVPFNDAGLVREFAWGEPVPGCWTTVPEALETGPMRIPVVVLADQRRPDEIGVLCDPHEWGCVVQGERGAVCDPTEWNSVERGEIVLTRRENERVRYSFDPTNFECGGSAHVPARASLALDDGEARLESDTGDIFVLGFGCELSGTVESGSSRLLGRLIPTQGRWAVRLAPTPGLPLGRISVPSGEAGYTDVAFLCPVRPTAKAGADPDQVPPTR